MFGLGCRHKSSLFDTFPVMKEAVDQGARMRMWRWGNQLLSGVVFGLPAVSAVPALVICAQRFGLRVTLTQALPSAVWASIPLLLWVVWSLRPARSRPARVVLVVSWVAGVATVVVSPLFFWAGPVILVLACDAARFWSLRRGTARVARLAGGQERAGGLPE
jgi:hypothetical protein